MKLVKQIRKRCITNHRKRSKQQQKQQQKQRASKNIQQNDHQKILEEINQLMNGLRNSVRQPVQISTKPSSPVSRSKVTLKRYTLKFKQTKYTLVLILITKVSISKPIQSLTR
ncbi:hypothetical protein ACTA71_004767 [Dictyostelium dimigraforme]